jgi:peptidoglycan hydrolase-like amidase
MLALLAAISLQAAVNDAMRGLDGAAILADLATGEVLAQYGLEKARARRVAPGSTLKPFTLAALIEHGAGQGQVACRGRLRIEERSLDCGHPRVAGALGAREALGYSCNEWFASMAQRLDPVKFSQRLTTFGFEAETAISAEQRSLQAIGEYGVRVTPAALLDAYRRLLRLKSEARYAAVFGGMEDAVEYGTGQWAAVPGLKVAGKTGTTANASRTDTLAWFAGYAPASKPEVVVVVFLERGKGGPSAAPIAKKMLAAWHGAPSGAQTPPRQGEVRVGRRDGKVVDLPIEQYVEAVLAGEAASFADQALQAMAVAARTYAAANRGRHKNDSWDFCDTSHCQNLRFDGHSARLAAAADATEGQLLWYAGKPAQTFYHRHCGGMTEAGAAVWPDLAAPYLKQQSDTFCVARGKAPWKVEAARRRVEILARTSSGRVARVRVDGRTLAVEAVLGELRLVSAWFDVRDQGDRVVFEGFGAGHGVGLCQTGTAERAKGGHSWQQILDFYYPGTRPGLNAQGLQWTRRGGERIDLYSTQPQQDGDVFTMAERAFREAEQRSGRNYTGRARLRLYPSVAAFRDATGEPGWVAASTRGSTVRMQPAAPLRSRGVLESTLLHEMLHVVLDQRAHPRLPDWFREGVVLWLTDPDKPAGAGAGSASGIAQAGSEAEMRRSYEAARSQVKRLVNRYGRGTVLSWVEAGVPATAINEANTSQQPSSSR